MSTISFTIESLNGSAAVHYIPVPFRCVVKDCQAAVDGDPGDAETLTLNDGTNDLGVLTFGSDIAAGATGTFVSDATNGNTVLEKDAYIKLTLTDQVAAITYIGHIELDEFARY